MKKKKESVNGLKGSMTRRDFIKKTGVATAGAVAATSLPLFNINHAWSKDVYYDGSVFDAGGASFNLADWPGFWEEKQRETLVTQFEKDFNCKVLYESSWPWFPRFVAGGVKNPPYEVVNWNLPELNKTAMAGDYLLPQDELVANIPNAKNLWPFALDNKIGITWGFGQYSYVYRTDLVNPPPTKFTDIWDKRFAGKRATYITSNGLYMVHFLTACYVFGGDQHNLKAGYKAMRDLMPAKIVDFTGNMQKLIERGEIHIGVQWEGEVYMQKDKGVPVDQYIWTEKKPILTQTKTVSRYSKPLQKKLAFAFFNRILSPGYLKKWAEWLYLRPTVKNAIIPKNLADQGVKNTADALKGLWIPDWRSYLEHEDDIVETVNEIFAG